MREVVQGGGEDLVRLLDDRLYAFNQDATGYRDGGDLCFSVEEDGEVRGLRGRSAGGGPGRPSSPVSARGSVACWGRR